MVVVGEVMAVEATHMAAEIGTEAAVPNIVVVEVGVTKEVTNIPTTSSPRKHLTVSIPVTEQ